MPELSGMVGGSRLLGSAATGTYQHFAPRPFIVGSEVGEPTTRLRLDLDRSSLVASGKLWTEFVFHRLDDGRRIRVACHFAKRIALDFPNGRYELAVFATDLQTHRAHRPLLQGTTVHGSVVGVGNNRRQILRLRLHPPTATELERLRDLDQRGELWFRLPSPPLAASIDTSSRVRPMSLPPSPRGVLLGTVLPPLTPTSDTTAPTPRRAPAEPSRLSAEQPPPSELPSMPVRYGAPVTRRRRTTPTRTPAPAPVPAPAAAQRGTARQTCLARTSSGPCHAQAIEAGLCEAHLGQG